MGPGLFGEPNQLVRVPDFATRGRDIKLTKTDFQNLRLAQRVSQWPPITIWARWILRSEFHIGIRCPKTRKHITQASARVNYNNCIWKLNCSSKRASASVNLKVDTQILVANLKIILTDILRKLSNLTFLKMIISVFSFVLIIYNY